MSNAKPHKSTTHEELYFHIREPHTDKKGKRYKAGTVFARRVSEEECNHPFWIACVTRCSETDNFCRTTGRNMARKRWFGNDGGDHYFAQSETKPTYEQALALYKNI